MKTLWVNTNFMHPTTKGGQIRTLEMLRHLHRRHEIHYVAIANPALPEGPARAHEYSFKSYPFEHRIPDKTSPAFYLELMRGLVSRVPVAVERFHPPGMRKFLEDLMRKEKFECAVVDHLAPTAYFPDLAHAVFFQHNVETMIWRRHVEHAGDPLKRAYFKLQADRMYHYERNVSREAGHIVAVSQSDADEMRRLFDVDRVTEIPTGVNLEYFQPPERRPASLADLVFVGSMDWLPNVDGVIWFVKEVLPLIRRQRPKTTVAVVGRLPGPKIMQLGTDDRQIEITGTVADIRPYLWGGAVSIVPLRIGGGTRLKIYEAMAAKIPVVSTTVGAEGLTAHPPDDIRIADTPEAFAAQCLELLGDAGARERVAGAAWQMVHDHFSWDHVARCFERVMEQSPRPAV
jgi:glycosyltransferase involved in cell wall biosynthesis